MGYSIQQRDSEFSIRPENVAPAFEALMEHIAEELKDATDLRQALLSFNWETDKTYTWLWFTGDRYSEYYPLIFSLLAPFVTSGSWVEMQGQEGEIWRWEFTDGEVYEQEGIIAWTGYREHIPAPELPLTGEQTEVFGG